MVKIDLVVPWVDGNDITWLEEKRKYSSVSWSEGNSNSRYSPSDNFKYWFRSVEKFAPWINKIFFVTYGHLPDWLDISHPKLRIVRHDEYIPKEYLPTFNSHVIELNLHCINDLSEYFILFSDDVFFTKETTENDFFENNLPREFGIYTPIRPVQNYSHIELNNYMLINRHFSNNRKKITEWYKFYNPLLGKFFIHNLIANLYNQIMGYQEFHLGHAHLKSTFKTVWDKEKKLLHNVSTHRFRELSDVNHFAMAYWNIESGKFEPQSLSFGKSFDIADVSESCQAIVNQKYKVICLNETDESGDITEYEKKIAEAFDKILFEKSSFEL